MISAVKQLANNGDSSQNVKKRTDTPTSALATKVYEQSKVVVATRTAYDKALQLQANARKDLIRANTLVDEAGKDQASAEAELETLERERRKEEMDMERQKLEKEKVQLEKRLKEVNDAMRKTEDRSAPATGRIFSDIILRNPAGEGGKENKRKERPDGEGTPPKATTVKEEEFRRFEEDVNGILRRRKGRGQ
jgi:hypothetical protein